MSDLSNVLHPKTYKLGLGSSSKYEVIEELLGLLVKNHDLSVRQLGPAREAIFRSERLNPSGSASGFAAPSATVDGLVAPVAALGTREDGVDFGSGKPAKVVLLLLTPSGSRAGRFPQLAALREQSVLVDDLASASSPSDAEQILKDLEA